MLFSADWTKGELKIREHHLYISKKYLVTVHPEPSPELKALYERLKETPELTKRGLPFLFYLVVDKLVDEVFTVIDHLDAGTCALEDAILQRYNREAAGQLGISASEIENTLYDAFGQRQVSTIYTATNEYWVVMEVLPQYQTDVSTLGTLYVPSAPGPVVPLRSVAQFTSTAVPAPVYHPAAAAAVECTG